MIHFSRILIMVVFVFFSSLFGNDFQHYFTPQGLRIDFFQVGNQSSETIVIDGLYQEKFWSGNTHNLIDSLNLGQYLLRVTDPDSNNLIFSHGFSTLFFEWKTTQEALSAKEKVMRATLRIPFPRQKIQLEFVARDRENLFTRILANFTIDPSDVSIQKEDRAMGAEIFGIMENGSVNLNVDLLFVGEGYTIPEKEKFESDLVRITEILFAVEPFQSHRESFNVTGILFFSEESGVDNPREDIYKNTAMNFSFNTFGSQRYLMTFDPQRLNDIVSAVPHDAIVVLINSDIYGGGGIYNFYAAVTADNTYLSNILVHELGHSFAGLGDEYYNAEIAYSDFYPVDVEPWEPNLTISTNNQKLKWRELLTPEIKIPTAWNKDEYESLNQKFQDRLSELSQSNSNDKEIKRLRKDYREKIRTFFGQHKLRGKTGTFEGAGYNSSDMYRPSLDCIMFSNRSLHFDMVCRAAIERRIHFLTRQIVSESPQ